MMDNTDPISRPMTRRTALVSGAAVAVVSIGLFAWQGRRPIYDGARLSAREAHKRATDGSVFLIDIRRPDEWKRTGIGEGAHPLDMRRKDFVDALTQLTGADLNAPIALICAAGVRSARMSRKLSNAGFTQIIDVPEGMTGSSAGPGWVATTLPVREFSGGSP